MQYAKSTGGFYDPAINVSGVPSDAVEITDQEYAALLEGQAGGQRIVAGDDGRPMLAAARRPTAAQIVEAIKAERDWRWATSGFHVAGKWFASDPFSRTQYLGLVLLGANLPAGLQWKTMDGSSLPMTQQLAGQVLAGAAASDLAIFSCAEAHIAAVNASPSPADYDFSGNWPPSFSA